MWDGRAACLRYADNAAEPWSALPEAGERASTTRSSVSTVCRRCLMLKRSSRWHRGCSLPTAMHGDAARRGQKIGRYHLHREIAKGGMARIHIARSVGSEGFTKLFAAKRLDPQLAN